MVWPAAIRAQAAEDLPPSVLAMLRKDFGSFGEIRFFDAKSDLNGDGKAEIIVHIAGPAVCGTGGCPTLVFAPQGSGYRLLARVSVSRPPIRVSPRSTRGWRNLIVSVSGGGIKSGDAELLFNGRTYASNPTVPPARRVTDLTGSTVLIAAFEALERGRPLAPAATPSFDCAKARTAAERAICSDAGLAALDRKLADSFARAVKNWEAAIAANERKNQREWLVARDRCTASPDAKSCMDASYRRRIVEVQIRSGQFVAPRPVTFQCQRPTEMQFTVTFYKESDPPSAVITAFGVGAVKGINELKDKQVIALQVPAGSGSKYETQDVQFWTKGNEAMATWFGTEYNCKIAGTDSAAPGLQGTSWRLVRIQSMDDTTLVPDDRSKYTISFGEESMASWRIDCNRGNGGYRTDGKAQLEFGLLALTRALCPPGSLDDRIVKHIPFIRSYMVKDGHLFLILMADGGTFEFEPLPQQ